MNFWVEAVNSRLRVKLLRFRIITSSCCLITKRNSKVHLFLIVDSSVHCVTKRNSRVHPFLSHRWCNMLYFNAELHRKSIRKKRKIHRCYEQLRTGDKRTRDSMEATFWTQWKRLNGSGTTSLVAYFNLGMQNLLVAMRRLACLGRHTPAACSSTLRRILHQRLQVKLTFTLLLFDHTSINLCELTANLFSLCHRQKNNTCTSCKYID